MLDASSSIHGVIPGTHFHHNLNDTNRLFQQNSYPTNSGSRLVSPFGQHLGNPQHNGTLRQTHAPAPTSQQAVGRHPHVAVVAAATAVAAMSQQPTHRQCVVPQLPHGLSNASQSIAAALFASSPLISNDLKLAAAAAAAAAQSRGKKAHRAEPVPQSGFKGVSWNSRMKAWLAFYVTENGERKSKTFSTRKLGMEEARSQAIAFCKQKQDQRRQARKKTRGLQHQHCENSMIGRADRGANVGLDRLSSDESILESSNTLQDQQQNVAMRCSYATVPDIGNTPNTSATMLNRLSTTNSAGSTTASSQASSNSDIAYIPIVPIALDMIEKSGLLQPLELTVLPPCQHCNKQPYPFLMIVSEGQEQTYSESSVMNLVSSHPTLSTLPANETRAPMKTAVPTPSGSSVGVSSVVGVQSSMLAEEPTHGVCHNSPCSDTETKPMFCYSFL